MKHGKSIIVIALIIATLTPFFAFASDLAGLDQLPVLITGIKATSQGLDKIPMVPTNDVKQNAKDTGVSVFGYNIGVSWNQLAITLAKVVVNQVVDSTVTWMQNGFEGSPAYVADPGTYFGNIGNGVLGDELNRLSKGVLCTPFQAKITLALKKANVGSGYSPQCTLTGIVKNYDNFIHDFNEGGWQAFFAISQNTSNNPYGAFADAQLSIDGKVTAEVTSATQEVSWGSGFKSQKVCKKKNITRDQALAWSDSHPNDASVPPGYDPKADFGACIEYGDVTTPGATIKSHLDEALPGNTFLKQITTADQFDKLLTALGQGLLQRFVFNQNGKTGGLLGAAKPGSGSSSSGDTNSNPQAAVTCSATPDKGTAGEDKVTWFATSNYDADTAVSFTWKDDYTDADGSINGKTGASVDVVYTTQGQKSASVIASTTKLDEVGNYIPSTHTDGKIFTCSNTVKVSKYHPLQVSCSADTSRIVMSSSKTVSDPVTWTAKVSGGSGNYTLVVWDGDQQVPPGFSGLASKIFPYELTPAQSNSAAITWCYVSGEKGSATLPHIGQQCSDFAKGGVKSSVTLQKLVKDAAATETNPIYDSTLTRVYFRDPKSNLGSVKAKFTVWDNDTFLDPVQDYECPAIPVLDN